MKLSQLNELSELYNTYDGLCDDYRKIRDETPKGIQVNFYGGGRTYYARNMQDDECTEVYDLMISIVTRKLHKCVLQFRELGIEVDIPWCAPTDPEFIDWTPEEVTEFWAKWGHEGR